MGLLEIKIFSLLMSQIAMENIPLNSLKPSSPLCLYKANITSVSELVLKLTFSLINTFLIFLNYKSRH